MLKKITWEEGKVFSLKLKEDLYTLVQMRADYYLQFFDLTCAQDEWKGMDLGKANTLFFIFTSTKALKSLAVSTPSPDEITIDKRPPEKKMLRAIIGGNYGADLIELPDSLEELEAKVLKNNLTLSDDLETIYKYELSGMVGDPEKLRERLINYFDNGINWDKSKEFLFKGISLPSAKKHMKNKELQNFKTYHLNLGSEEKFAAKVKILYDRLIDNLMLLPEKETQLVILENFKQCILNINNFEDEIETVERESVLEHIYAIGEIVGLDPTSEYAEEWRGDW